MSTTMTMAPPRVAFDVDAMLMYGWVADAQQHITEINQSLRQWIRDHIEQAPEANRLLDAFLEEKRAVTVPELLDSLLDSKTEEGTADLVAGYMTRLEARLNERENAHERVRERHGDYSVLLQYRAADGNRQPLLGARFVRDSATLLASEWNADRVDIVVVVIVEQHGGWWRVRGFQGQLQEAWLRVANRIVDGNRAGGIALMARNLSHNIGSHALYWVAADESDGKKDFLTYMQVRMELLAGFATNMPLSPVLRSVPHVLQRFNDTKLLLDNICRSEEVSKVDVQYEGDAMDAVFFGGEVGVHAFYSILENCIRDSSKHASGGSSASLTMHVVATELDKFVQIDVFDEAQNFARDGEGLQAALDSIRISDESGNLDPRHWGIKERFVCAAILRGYRPENLPIQPSARPGEPWVGVFSRQKKRVLEVVNVKGNCAWRFYLPRRSAEILLVSDNDSAPPIGVERQSFDDFKEAASSPTGITASFVVLDRLPEKVRPSLLEAWLPHRIYVRSGMPRGRFLDIDTSANALTPTALLKRSVESLLASRPQGRRAVRLVLAAKKSELTGQLIPDDYDDPVVTVINENHLLPWIDDHHQKKPAESLMVFCRHDKLIPDLRQFYLDASTLGVEHLEFYEYTPATEAAIIDASTDRRQVSYRLLEAALTKILIIDERLDISHSVRGGGLARHKLLLRGIEIQGGEFAGHAKRDRPATLADLGNWSEGFHIVMLHKGVVEKLVKNSGLTADAVVASIEAKGARVVIHSGRMWMMTDMPEPTKFLSLANVTTWIDQEYSKLQIIDELFSLRRV
jgi:hypothetical protein